MIRKGKIRKGKIRKGKIRKDKIKIEDKDKERQGFRTRIWL
jgi:hypothetical protein